MPVYSLPCGNCLTNNNVSADDPAVQWVCGGCDNESVTSLPTKADGTMVTDASKAGALLTPQEASQAIKVVIAEAIDGN